MRLGFGVGASDKVNLIGVKETQELMRLLVQQWLYGSHEHVEYV